MKILVVCHGFPPQAEGGSEVYAAALAHAFHALYGDLVHVLAREADPSRPDYAVRRESREGMDVTWINNTFRDVRSFAESYANPRIDAVASETIDAVRPDVAHVHHLTCLSTTIVDRLAERGIPVFYTLHDYWLLCHRGQLLDTRLRPCAGPEPHGCRWCLGNQATAGRAMFAGSSMIRAIEPHVPASVTRGVRQTAEIVGGWFASEDAGFGEARARFDHMRHVMSRVTHFLAPSASMRERFLASGLTPASVSHHRLGFDPRPFAGVERVASPVLRLGFLGSLMVSKAPHVLLEAFARLPEGASTLDLFGSAVPYHGDDGYRARLAPLLATPGVTAHGAIRHDAVPAALAGIDVLVVPSVWQENSPLVIHEAFLAGTPVVASNIGGIPEIVTDGANGLLFRPGDVDDLHRQLRRLLDEPELLPSLRRGIGPVRTLADDARATRDLFEAFAQRDPPTVTPQRMAAVVLNFGAPDDTFLAIRSLLGSARPPDHVIVVDNDQDGRCRGVLRPFAESITFISNDRNLGFSGGMNAGIREALAGGADVVVLVNSDLVLPPRCLERLERTLAHTRHAGIAGPAVLSRADPDRITSLGMRYSAGLGRMRHRATGRPLADVALGPVTLVDGVSGCLMMIKREVFDAVGLLDDAYFFSFEDLEFCLRAARAGFVTVVDPAARVFHEGGRSMGATSPRRLYFATRNHLMMARRARPGAGPLRTAIRTSSVLALNVAHAVRAPGGTLASRLGAVARGARDYIGGRSGDGG